MVRTLFLFSSNHLKITSIILATAVFLGCGNAETEKTEDKKMPEPPKESHYLHAFNKDTVRLTLIDSNQHLTGKLDYLPYEKDGTIGDLYDITISGDTLFGMYKSEQEGIQSIGEFAMLKVGKSYILTDDIWGGENYKYDSSYTNGKFIDKSKISFRGDTLTEINSK